MNGVTIGERIIQTLQQNDGDTVARHGAFSLRIERAAMSVGSVNATFLKLVTGFLRQRNGDAAGKGHVTFAAEQTLVAEMDRHQ